MTYDFQAAKLFIYSSLIGELQEIAGFLFLGHLWRRKVAGSCRNHTEVWCFDFA